MLLNEILKRYMEFFANCQDITNINTWKLMKEDECHSVLVKDCNAKNGVRGIQYVKDVTEVPRKQVKLCEKDYIVFRLELENTLLRSAFLSMNDYGVRSRKL